jgi:hypothetical protein
LTVVVSPLISLMKDQVDGLVACGVAAAQLNSSQSGVEQRDVERALTERKLRLLFVSPERLALSNFRQLLGRVGVAAFAIDEVMDLTARVRSTIAGYLADFIVTERPATIDAWLDREQYDLIAPAVERLGTERLKPIFEDLEGRISYDDIRLVVAHRVARVSSPAVFTRSRGDAEENRLSSRLRDSA